MQNSFANRSSDIKFRQTMKEYSAKQRVVSPPFKLTPQKATPSASKKRILSASRTLTFAKTAFPNLKSMPDEPPILERFPSTDKVLQVHTVPPNMRVTGLRSPNRGSTCRGEHKVGARGFNGRLDIERGTHHRDASATSKISVQVSSSTYYSVDALSAI